jgi:hypothetical protein
MSHHTVIMNGGESPLASKLKNRAAAPAYESHPGEALASPTEMDGGAAPTHGSKTKAPPAASAEPGSLAGGSGIMRPRSKK